MIPAFFRATVAGEVLLALGVAAASVPLAWLAAVVFERTLRILVRRTPTVLDDLLLHALVRPVFLLVFLVGVYAALTITNRLDPYQDKIDKGLLVVVLVLLVYTLNRVALAFLGWYTDQPTPRAGTGIDRRTLPVVRRIVTISIMILGALTIIQAVGVPISPILAGLGIGGLAVALAIHPTLQNLIAGAYTVSEGRIGVSDYIRLQDGAEGVVQDVGWRTTKLTTPHGALLVIPNARLADNVVTNFSAPGPGMVAILQCGLAATGDVGGLQRALETAARAAAGRLSSALLEAEPPVVVFRALTDGRADFDILLRVQSHTDQHRLVEIFVAEMEAMLPPVGDAMELPVRRLTYLPGGNPRRGA